MRRALLITASLLLFSVEAPAQTTRDLLIAALHAHIQAPTPLTDIMGVGSLTNDAGKTQNLTVYSKGSDRVRFEIGDGGTRQVLIFNRANGSVAFGSRVRPLEQRVALRRATVFPFLDLIAEIDNPQLETTLVATGTLGTRRVNRVHLRLKDPTPGKRYLSRDLDEELDLYIDSQTSLILRSERFRATENNLDLKIPSVLDFSDYRDINGFLIPFRIVNTVGSAELGRSQSTLIFTNILVNSSIPDSLFSTR